jgi:hypothetical protein
MRGTLLVTILKIQSSYARNVEETMGDASGVPDTLQWWISSDAAWRIKTYALDHDIHTHSVGLRPDLVALARANNRKHYEGQIASEHTLEFSDCTDAKEVASLCNAAGIAERIEVASDR